MEINLGDEKIIELVSPFSAAEIQERMTARRLDAFGTLAKFMQRPRWDEIVISHSEIRYEPFWHASARARYYYDRRQRYQVPIAPEVQGVSLYDHDHPVVREQGRHFTIDAIAHCLEESTRELTLDPTRGEERDYQRYLAFGKKEVSSLEDLQADGALVVSPEVRGSFVVRKLVQLLMRNFQADKVHEERIDVEQVTLYFRPVHAFEYHWTSKDKRTVLEFDALTGDVRMEGGQMKKQVVKVLENDTLFDIGADTIGTIMPGANIAVKLGRIAVRKAIG